MRGHCRVWRLSGRYFVQLQTACVVPLTSDRIHSMEMVPCPAPTSHSNCPGRGAKDARVEARTSRLVMVPSWLKASSGSPGIRDKALLSGPDWQ